MAESPRCTKTELETVIEREIQTEIFAPGSSIVERPVVEAPALAKPTVGLGSSVKFESAMSCWPKDLRLTKDQIRCHWYKEVPWEEPLGEPLLPR
jgi:hypothetical protein